MILGDERHTYRKVYFEAWKKYSTHQDLSDLEKQLVQLILIHPEYHFILKNLKNTCTRIFFQS